MPIPTLRIADYTYTLPEDRIARYPLPERDASRLLHYREGAIADAHFRQLPQLLPTGALLVYNDSRVIPARLHLFTDTGARVEILCLEPLAAPVEAALSATGTTAWQCMVGNLKRWKGKPLKVEWPDGRLEATYEGAMGSTHRVRFHWTPADATFSEVLQLLGQLPIPPYLNRAPEPSDAVAYQTVFAQVAGSVAAPTAGLHFSDRVLADLAAQGVQRLPLTLHVGAGTFLPVKSEEMGGHEMHTETFAVGIATLLQLAAHSGPVVAVGTTSLRTLESLYWLGCRAHSGQLDEVLLGQWTAYEAPAPLSRAQALQALAQWLQAREQHTLHGRTQILIAPGYTPRMADALVTNFHQPQSTLLLLIAAWVGADWHRLYDHALAQGYRFLSYGDSSLLWRQGA